MAKRRMIENPVCVSTWYGDGAKHFGAFLATARKHGIEPQNADPSKWEGRDWTEIPWHKKPEAQLRFLLQNRYKHSHFMFVDSYDVVFDAGWDEILAKYYKIGSPVVFGSECYPWPKPDQAGLYPETSHRCKYLNAGFWMADTESALALLNQLHRNRKEGQCDQGAFVDLFLSDKAFIHLDTACSICFCCNMNSLDFLEVRDGRITCKDTGEKPCLFHGNGNSPLHVVCGMLA